MPRDEATERLRRLTERPARPPGETPPRRLVTAQEVRDGVQAMATERGGCAHPVGSREFERQQGELNALNAVVRLIDTGHWRAR